MALYIFVVCLVAAFIGVPDFVGHTNFNASVAAFTKNEHLICEHSMDSELVAVGHGVRTAIYADNLRDEAGFPARFPAIIFCDNAPAIRFLTDSGSVPNRMTRHLRRRVEWITDAVRLRKVQLKHVPTALNCADLLTKALGPELHRRHARNLMGDPADRRWPSQFPCGCSFSSQCRVCGGCPAHFCAC